MDLFSLENLVALLTLTALEVVLGIDNIVFVVVIANRLPQGVRDTARRLGLGLAMATRILLLLAISWIMRLTAPLFSIWEHAVSGRDLVLLLGGLFLLGKATLEMHGKIEEHASPEEPTKAAGSLVAAVLVMLFFSGPVGRFVNRHPTVQMLAFAFLLLVGVFLVAEGLGKHIDRGYIYFAMAFSLFVELLNLRIRGKT